MLARRTSLVASLAVAATLAPAAARAQFVVTQPAGASQTVDPFPGFAAWYRDDVRPGATAGITTDYARNGNGSMLLTNVGSGAKANVALYFPPLVYPFTRLGDVVGFGYEYYRDGSASATSASHLAPAMRLLVDADGDFSTNDRGSLIYEPVYNGVSSVAVDTWTPVNVGSSTILWWYQGTGGGVEEVYTRTLGDYATGNYTPTGSFAQLSGSSVVYGLSFGTGSGWSGDFRGAVDDVYYATHLGPFPVGVSWNFETAVNTSTPEPASIALMATGLLTLGGIVRRRRRGA